MERADEPIEEGTPINKVLFNSIKEDFNINIPKGLICMWSGSEVPTGWYLCDGTNETPDLRDRFVVGAGSEYSIGDMGGEKEHSLTTEEMPSHQHILRDHRGNVTTTDVYHQAVDYLTIYENTSGSVLLRETKQASSYGQVNTTSVGSNLAHENRPPYYALAFIMKA